MRFVSVLVLVSALICSGCVSTSFEEDSPSGGVYDLISEQYIRGPNDTIGSSGPRARGSTVCTYVSRETGARDIRRYPGGMPCPPNL
ncbi:MAG: hypothetical protein AAFR07_12160 [Pseudomonadota bacterium]